MPGSLRFAVSLVREEGSRARLWAQSAAVLVTVVVAALVLPGPWDEEAQAVAKLPERELAELRSARSKTFREPDGRLKTTLFEQSVHFLDRSAAGESSPEGKWREIDATFADSAKVGVGWESGANRFSVELAQQTKAGFVSFGSRAGTVSLSLQGATVGKPGARVASNAVSFADALPGVDVEYVVLPDGLKESIVLRRPGSPSEYRFVIAPESGGEWHAEKDGGGFVLFSEKLAEPAFALLAPVVGDSAGAGAPADAAAAAPKSFEAAPGKASMEVEPQADGSFLVSMRIDELWLNDKSRVFPVVLDPTLFSEPDVADGEYDTTTGGNPNVTSATMRTGKNGSAGSVYASVATFSVGSLPPAAKVLDARLNLFLEGCFPSVCSSSSTGDVELRYLTSGWSGSTPWSAVTKNATVQDKVSFTTTPVVQWYQWASGTFTQTVQSMVNGSLANFGFVLEKTGGTSTVGYSWRTSRYSDPTYQPYLEVYWVADGVQVSPAMHLHSNGAELSWQHYAGGTSAYADAVAQDVPVGYWRLDEPLASTTVWDWSGNDNTGTVQNSSSVTRAEAGALSDGDLSTKFLGTGYVSVPDAAVLHVNDVFTAEAWVRRSDLVAREMVFLSQGGTGFRFQLNPSNKLQLLKANPASSIVQSTATITDTNWHYVVATKNGATVKLYLDGADVTGSVTNTTLTTPTGSTYVATNPSPSLPWFGWVDEAAIYPTALSAARVQAHWNASTALMPGFVRYEIHRSATANFAPSASTLIGTVADAAVQTWRDTSAKPNPLPAPPIFYKVVTFTDEQGGSSFSSNEVAANLPAAGTAEVTIQPGYVSLRASGTHISSATPTTEQGSSQTMVVGSAGTNKTRALLQFDSRDIPSGVTVTSALLQMYATGTTPALNAQRLSAMWGESATWNTRLQTGSIAWATAGGDFDSTASASSVGGTNAHWDSWTLTSLVQEWLNGTKSHFGVLFKYGSENGSQPTLSFAADGFARSVALRPKLTVTYQDGSDPVEPTASIASPAPNKIVSGTVTVTASAADDGAVKQVQFFRDSTSIGTDTDGSNGWSVSWSTTGLTVGQTYQLKAEATDDAGNVTVSAPLTPVKIGSSHPTVSVSTSVSLPNVTATATASDDVAVTRVEFFADGDRFAEDTSSPYSAVWNTLDESNTPGYDGTHAVTAVAYDADGNFTASAASNVSITNTSGTKYKGTFATTAIPQDLTYDPGAPTQESQPVDVTITNTSTVNWPTASIKLRYRWVDVDGAAASPTPADVSIGADLGAGGNRTVRVNVDPPQTPDGTDRARYRLRIDLYDTGASATFASKGNKPFDAYATVTRKTLPELGLEGYQRYDGEPSGLGIEHRLNVANGNNLIRWTPLSEPGRGLDTALSLTYNSREQGSTSPAGNNVSLSVSGLLPLGLPLDIHPNAADTLAGRTAKWVGFTDGDGTYHRFDGFAVTGGTAYDAPPGVFLYLREDAAAPAAERWSVTRPDRVTFYFDASGWPTSVKDRNGNRLEFTLATVPAGEDVNGLAKRVTKVTDAAGLGGSPAPNRDFEVFYWSKAETGRPQLRGKIKRIEDHVNHALRFDYYEDGNLLRVTEEGGTNADGSYLADRSVVFNYVNQAATGPAISTYSARLSPDPKTVQSRRLYSVIDPRGGESAFAYESAAGANKWRLTSRTDRAGKQATFSYPSSTTTHVVRPASREEEFIFDTAGRVTQIKDPLNFGAGAVTSITTVAWFTTGAKENLVQKVTQPHGEFSEFDYNDNGYKTDEWDELRNHTVLAYENVAVDGNDVSGKWETGRTIPHISQLDTKTDPVGVATTGSPTDYKWLYDYDANGNLTLVTDPLGKTQTTVWNADGTVQKQTDALNRDTVYNSYDANGLATQVTDAAGGVAKSGYDDRGNLLWLQDANHASFTGGNPRDYRSYHDYDSFGRAGRSSEPRSTALRPGELVWSTTTYDASDNAVQTTSPHYGRSTAGVAAATTTTFDAMDRPTLVSGPRKTSPTTFVRTQTVYDDAGRVTKVTRPNGVESSDTDDYTAFTSYDRLDRVFQEWSFEVSGGSEVAGSRRTSSYCYDLAGDLRSTTAPKGAAAFTGCPAIVAPASYVYTSAGYTTKYEYDDAHRQTKQTVTAALQEGGAPTARVTQTGYDVNGQVTSTTDADGFQTTTTYTDRGERQTVVEPFDTGRTLTSRYEYDAGGNLQRMISPRAYDAAAGSGVYTDYVEEYTYDGLDRLTRTKLPTGPNAYAPTVRGQTPYAHWRLGEASGTTMADASGNGRNGSYVNNPTLGVAGALTGDANTALTAAAANQQATVSGMALANQSFSIGFWMKRANTGTNDIAVAQGTNTTNNGLQVGFLAANTFRFGFHGNDLTTTATYTDTGWHYWAATYNATSNARKIYRDGLEVASGTASADYQGTGSLVLASTPWSASGDSMQNSSLDEVAVWTRELNAAEVQHQAGAGLTAPTPQAYAHRSYDPNGNLLQVSLPSTWATIGGVAAADLTTNTYWDGGQIYSGADTTVAKVRYEYAAEGWQTLRVPEAAVGSGTLDYPRLQGWGYTPDGLLAELRDSGGQRAVYVYDADGNRTSAAEAQGLTASAQAPLAVTSQFDDFDELTRVCAPKAGSSNVYGTLFVYDLHGNTTSLTQNREESSCGGSQLAAGRVEAYVYNEADEPLTQIDDFATGSTADDEKISMQWTPTGREAYRKLEKANGAAWTGEQDTTRGYYRNGRLKTLVSTDMAASPVTLEQHTLSYEAGGVYLNGNRASDVFVLHGPDAAAPCRLATSPCTQSWTYDARERLMLEFSGTGDRTEFAVDAIGNVTQEKLNGTVSRTATYSGQQLQTETIGATTKRSLYDSLGNLDCVVTSSYSGAGCPGAGASLYVDNIYDYKSRLAGYRNYNLTTSAVDSADYTNDPLDRPIKVVETHSGVTTTTDIVYIGLSDMVAKETQTGGANTTKTHAYDPLGRRTTLSDGVGRYSYLNDPHASVSLVIDQNRAVKAAYGYAAYGGGVASVTKLAVGFGVNSNVYRYSGKRFDTGSATYDMGARRYTTATGRFLQRDDYNASSGASWLAEAALTANRYALAAGNPVNYIETFGHYPVPIDEGAGGTTGTGTPPPPTGGPPGPAPPTTDPTKIRFFSKWRPTFFGGAIAAADRLAALTKTSFRVRSCVFSAERPEVRREWGTWLPGKRKAVGQGVVSCTKPDYLYFSVCTQKVRVQSVVEERCNKHIARLGAGESTTRIGPEVETRWPCPVIVFRSRIRTQTQSATSLDSGPRVPVTCDG